MVSIALSPAIDLFLFMCLDFEGMRNFLVLDNNIEAGLGQKTLHCTTEYSKEVIVPRLTGAYVK